jgi:DNA-binding LacI/PurR family transcriptional regulator/signal transduction histidine kinase
MAQKTVAQRKTIGLLTTQIGRVWGTEFINGIADAAEDFDVNLICFAGGTPSATIYAGQLQPSYGIYDLANTKNIDGLILSADLGHRMKPDEVASLCENFGKLPIVANALDLPNIPNMIADNVSAMRQMVRHLIEEHGYRKIAFVRGPEGQLEAEQRYQAYCDELKVHNISYDSKLVTDGDFSPESGRNAVRLLLDERKMHAEAIVCVNDRCAFGVMDALQMRGISVPGEIAVTGFDDITEAQTLGVPLTTIRQSFYAAGRQSIESVLARIEGKNLPHSIVIPSEMIIRWSCGCLPESVRKAVVSPEDVAKTGQLENKTEAAVRALLQTANISKTHPSYKKLSEIFSETWKNFLTSLRSGEKNEAFLKELEASISILHAAGAEPHLWHNVVSTLRHHALASIKDPSLTLQAENLFQQARLLVGEIAQRRQAYRRLQMEQQEEVLQSFSFGMATSMSVPEIGFAIEQNFPTMGIPCGSIMLYSDISHPQGNIPPPLNYRLLMRYDEPHINIAKDRPHLMPGHITPEGQTPQHRRYRAMVMPLTLGETRFGFIWMEVGPKDWEVYVRVRNLVTSALLRTLLVEQREQAKEEVDRLLAEAKQRATELASAKEAAEQAAELTRLAAEENEMLYQSEQERRRMAESLVKVGRQLSSLLTIQDVPRQILEQLQQITPYERGSLILEENGATKIVAAHGFPDDKRAAEVRIEIRDGDVYHRVTEKGEPVIIEDVTQISGWKQVDWLPINKSWMGVPLFSKNRVVGMLSLTRVDANSFSEDDLLVVSTFAMQAAIALENARLYDEITRFSELLERMVSQRTEELNEAYRTLEKLDKNKSTFISVAAHELRTPLTVMKGYLGMMQSNPTLKSNDALQQAVEGVLKGTDRLYEIINSMLDVARIDSQVLTPRLERTDMFSVLKFVQGEYTKDATERNISLTISGLKELPPIMVDAQLIQKAFNGLVINAIKFTPDGGKVEITGAVVQDERLGECVEIRVADNGIGIDPANHKLIFEKLYQLGKVELHSSGRSKFKGGGPGLGLAISAGIVKAHQGKIWVESPGQDEETCPGSTFFVRLPINPQKP